MSARLVTVFGSDGFIGRYVVRALARSGFRIRAVTRKPHTAGFLRPLGAVGQIQIEKGDVKVSDSVRRLVAGSDAVVNLVGILHNSGSQTFRSIHEEAPHRIAQACAEHGVRSFVQISAIGASEESSSAYARSKARGEQLAWEALPSTVAVRPSLVFGSEDGFFNRFAGLAQISPALPLIGGGKNLVQPVYVGDLASAVDRILNQDASGPRIFEIGGPTIYSFKEVMELVLEYSERERLLVPIPYNIAKALGAVLGVLPNPQLTMDQVELLKADNVVRSDGSVGTLNDLNILPRSVEQIVPTYLYRFRKHGQYDDEPVAES